MSNTISSGARKSNGAGLPMLSFRMRAPASSMRSASSTTGPRTSYSTLSSLVDFLISRMVSLLGSVRSMIGVAEASACAPAAGAAPPAPCDELAGPLVPSAALRDAASGSISPAPSISHAAGTPSMSASTSPTGLRGTVLPFAYWLTWLFPSFIPRSPAMRMRSACL